MAYDFNGTTQYLVNSSWTEISDVPFTMAAWMYIDASQSAMAVALQRTAVNVGVLGLTPRSDGPGDKIGAIIYDGSIFPFATSSGSYSTGVWCHGVAVLSSSTSRTAYLNGTAGSENTTSSSFGSLNRFTIGADLMAGSPAADLFNGRIAEVGVWNVALTADEAASLAKGFKPHRIRPQSLKFYAPLVADIRDLARGLALTNTNTATVVDHTRVY